MMLNWVERAKGLSRAMVFDGISGKVFYEVLGSTEDYSSWTVRLVYTNPGEFNRHMILSQYEESIVSAKAFAKAHYMANDILTYGCNCHSASLKSKLEDMEQPVMSTRLKDIEDLSKKTRTAKILMDVAYSTLAEAKHEYESLDRMRINLKQDFKSLQTGE